MKKKNEEQQQQRSNGPVFMKRVGSIKLSIFENTAAEGGQVYSNIALVRRYRSADGAWHDSNVFNGVVDALSARECLDRAIAFIHEREESRSETTDEEGR